MRKSTKITIVSLVTLLFLSIIIALTVSGDDGEAEEGNTSNNESKEGLAESIVDHGMEVADDYVFPADDEFEKIAENDNLILKVDTDIGHFIVENKSTGKVTRSFPNPEAWDEEQVASAWQVHLKSPFMFSYVEFEERSDILKESNLLNQDSYIDHELIDDGIRFTYEMHNLGFIIPVEIKLGEDYVETRVLAEKLDDVKVFGSLEELEEAQEESNNDEVVEENNDGTNNGNNNDNGNDDNDNNNNNNDSGNDDEIKDPRARLVSLRLFPFLGADSSDDEDGFLLLPDGPGVLVDFKQNRASTTNLYNERIYGNDLSFATRTRFSPRQEIRMPIFGLRSKDQGFLGVVHEGDMYTNIVAAPSESYSNYNWVTAEHQFRFKYFQPTDRRGQDGHFRYSEDIQRRDRTVRYYVMDKEDLDYVDLATKYREYLQKDKGLEKLDLVDQSLKLNLNILGGGTQKGFLFDSFLSLTTPEQATEIVQGLTNSGIEEMSVKYLGWQNKGYGKFGGHFPISRKVGGNEAMKEFIDFANSKDIPVYFDASSYTYNNTGKDRFRASRDGLRDLGNTVMNFRRAARGVTLVSPKVMEKTILEDVKHAKELGVDGYLFGDALGSELSTDYNRRYQVSRAEALDLQRDIIDEIKSELGGAEVAEGNFYTIDQVSHIEQLSHDYSYDLFVDDIIPFAQISLHGLVTYSFNYGNMSGNATESFLKGIEYGAEPTYLVTHEESHRLLESESMYRFYSTNFKDWENEIIEQYQKYNYALKDVQDEFITGHKEIARNVFETTYENGHRIIVNYNEGPYIDGDIRVEAQDFVVIEGGN